MFACNLHRQIPLEPKQRRIEKGGGASLSKSNCSWKEGGGCGGAERRRRRRRCNLSEGLQGVLAEHDCRLKACPCVCACAVTSPREFRAKQHQRWFFSHRTIEQEIKNVSERRRRLRVNIPFDWILDNREEVDQEGRGLVPLFRTRTNKTCLSQQVRLSFDLFL